MNPITTEVVITNDHKLSLNIDLPKDYPTGTAIVTLTVEPKVKTVQSINSMAELCGKYEGQIWTSEDFDEPLEDFAEYM
jgi:hypothetical protein